MTRFLSILLLLGFAVASYGQGVPSPATPWPMVDSAGNSVSSSHPMPVTLVATSAGQLTYTTVQVTAATANSTGALVASLAARLVVRITNIGTETVWVAENSSVGTVSAGLPVLSNQYYEETLSPSIPVHYIASSPTKVTIFQGK